MHRIRTVRLHRFLSDSFRMVALPKNLPDSFNAAIISRIMSEITSYVLIPSAHRGFSNSQISLCPLEFPLPHEGAVLLPKSGIKLSSSVDGTSTLSVDSRHSLEAASFFLNASSHTW